MQITPFFLILLSSRKDNLVIQLVESKTRGSLMILLLLFFKNFFFISML